MKLPSPADPTPRFSLVKLRDGVQVKDDAYSDRVRCDHPPVDVDAEWLGGRLVELAEEQGRGRAMVFGPKAVVRPLVKTGFAVEAVMPEFYKGSDPCFVLAREVTQSDADEAPDKVPNNQRVDLTLSRATSRPEPQRGEIPTRRATAQDAPAIAKLIDSVFEYYPTPSGNPGYLEASIAEGQPFRVIEDKGRILACASADLIPEAQTAELTDCVTHPSARGRGFMQAILTDLQDDLRGMGHKSAFTLARASIVGVNLAFWRLGFSRRGQMQRSCRIGTGLEDMNVWSRAL